jgi:hypothetical protein
MKPMGLVGMLLMVVGLVVVAMGGMRYLKDKDTTHVGPVAVTTEEHGFITPMAGVAAIAVGAVFLAMGRDKRTA